MWEHDNYILIREETDELVAKKNNLTVEQLNSTINECKKVLLTERNKRIRPGLDDKILTSWNALMIKACCDAYDVFDDDKFLTTAINANNFIEKYLTKKDGTLIHSTHPKKLNSTVEGNTFLEDYSFTIEALIALYQSTFDEKYLNKADELMKYAITHFMDTKTGMFYFTTDTDSSLIHRKMETEDNVIPASNSSISKSLFLLGYYFENEQYMEQSKKMTRSVKEYFTKYPSSFTNWGMLAINHLYPFHEIVIAGKDAGVKRKEINLHFIPNKLIAGSTSESKMPLLQNRFNSNGTLIYVCVNHACLLPVEKVEEAVMQIKK